MTEMPPYLTVKDEEKNSAQGDSDISSDDDWDLPLCFDKPRHLEPIKGAERVEHTWRVKEKYKTHCVALVLCLNVGVDPPDVVKTQPCARLECWIDPQSLSASKALESIGHALQSQYERWQPRARYKQSLDPTSDEVKKLCCSLRRNAKDERVLFHYNGHGVPKPTAQGEIWVFNRAYTQYIPLSMYDLQTWMGAPSLYVYDCSNAGVIVDNFKQFADQHEREYEAQLNSKEEGTTLPPPVSYKNCIQLAACAAGQSLPMNPELPADLFTACLTTPVKMAMKWFVLRERTRVAPPDVHDLIDKIPGQVTDRRTMLGELNWIFTAITDTIAWSSLSPELFQQLFRADLLTASLCRNFLLADRILRSYNCTPVSAPALPSLAAHPLWAAWEHTLDLALAQLPRLHGPEPAEYTHSPFFRDQLTAFQVWLELGKWRVSRAAPAQLPMVLQVLLSTLHRVRALRLLCRFLALGAWAARAVLNVGIFPYMLKLLQASAPDLRPSMVYIWAKIIAVDPSCQVDLVNAKGHKYFLSVLQDPSVDSEHRTLAAYVLAGIVDNYPAGQEAALQGSMISVCLEQLNDGCCGLALWACVCLGRLWRHYDAARWAGVRDLAHEKLFPLLTRPAAQKASISCRRPCAILGIFAGPLTPRRDRLDASPTHATMHHHALARTALARALAALHRLELSRREPASLPPSPGSRAPASPAPAPRRAARLPHAASEDSVPHRDRDSTSSNSSQPVKKAIVTTQFVEWAAAQFARAEHGGEGGEPGDDVESRALHERAWRAARNRRLRAHAQGLSAARVSRLETAAFHSRCPLPAGVLQFHPYEQHAAVAFRHNFGVWDWGTAAKLCVGAWQPAWGRITALAYLNAHAHALLAVAGHTGQLAIYRPGASAAQPALLSAWRALDTSAAPAAADYRPPPAQAVYSLAQLVSEQFASAEDRQASNRTKQDASPNSCRYVVLYHPDVVCRAVGAAYPAPPGTLLRWCGARRSLALAGRSARLRLWDAEAELLQADIPTESDAAATALWRADDLLLAGFGDGSVRAWDGRGARAPAWRLAPHAAPVLAAAHRADRALLVTGASDGELRVYDTRKMAPLETVRAPAPLAAIDVHPLCDLVACGSVNQSISIYDLKGTPLNTIKFHEGFMGARIGPVSCLAFHPLRCALGVGSKDSTVSVYVAEARRDNCDLHLYCVEE
ncbi:hypothetical protein SFRURICE_014756 [Spodoptera frugiperda]|nr:hypothetical protein SFRURICE_014756 [Spodoptera frugiperda]